MTLYSQHILRLAADTTHVGLPDDRTIEGRWTNPLCGDSVAVGAVLVDGVLDSIGFEAQACAVCRASAAAMSAHLTGKRLEAVGESLEGLERALADDDSKIEESLRPLTSVLPFRSRHACVLLPWRALEDAFAPRDEAVEVTQKSLDVGSSAWQVALDLQRAGDRAAIATLVEIEGSSPCPLGAKMVVSSNGQFWGSVSGGCVESAVVQAATQLMLSPTPAAEVLDYQISNSQAGEVGLPCGGRIRVLLSMAPAREELEQLASQPVGLTCATSLQSGETRLQDDENAPDAWRDITCGLARTGDETWFVEHVDAREKLVLVGGTHIAQKLARIAVELDFDVVVIDPRPALANAERFPGVQVVCERPEDVLPKITTRATSVVMLTHDKAIDDPALAVALRGKARYVAALGSRKTQRGRLERLRQTGLSAEELGRLHGPAGLAIGAVGAAEIALSIMAEVVAERRAASNSSPRVAGVILAAGSSKRAGPNNKLLHPFDGVPMVRRVVETARAAGLSPCIVVLGHEADEVREALVDLTIEFVHNDDYERGMGTSIAAGIKAVADADAAIVMLGDMPLVRTDDVERLVAAHQPSTQHLIVAPEAGSAEKRRLGNPVLWPRRYFGQLAELDGDHGGKHIILRAPGAVLRIPIEHEGVLRDFDTFDDSQHPLSTPEPNGEHR